jgi:hypothetical protein
MAASHQASHRLSRRLGALITLDALIFGASNAAQAPTWLIMVGFLALSATIYYTVQAVFKGLSLYGISLKRKKTLSLYVTLVMALLMALQSVGELGTHDFVVLLPLALIGYFYNAYSKTERA